MAVDSNRPLDQLLAGLRRLVNELTDQRLIDYVALDPAANGLVDIELIWIDPECDRRARYQTVHYRDGHGHAQRALLRRTELTAPADFLEDLEREIESLNRSLAVRPSAPPTIRLRQSEPNPSNHLLGNIRAAVTALEVGELEQPLARFRRAWQERAKKDSHRPPHPSSATARARQAAQIVLAMTRFTDYQPRESRVTLQPVSSDAPDQSSTDDWEFVHPLWQSPSIVELFQQALASLTIQALYRHQSLIWSSLTMPHEELRAIEARLAAGAISIATVLADQAEESVTAWRQRMKSTLHAAGLSARSVAARVDAILRQLRASGLADEFIHANRVSLNQLIEWQRQHNWWFGRLWLPESMTKLPELLLPFPTTLSQRLVHAARLPTRETLTLAGDYETYRLLATSTFRGWFSGFHLQSQIIKALRGTASSASFIRFYAVEERAVAAGLNAFKLFECVVTAGRPVRAIRRVARILQASGVVTVPNADSMATALVDSIRERCQVVFANDGVRFAIDQLAVSLTRRNSREWLRQLELGCRDRNTG